MNCPICSQPTIVLQTIGHDRRRECTACRHRFTTVEVLKVDQQRLHEAVDAVREMAERLKTAA